MILRVFCSVFRVRLFVSGFRVFGLFVYVLAFSIVNFDWALADSIVTRFLESVIVPSVVVVARSGLPALADGGFSAALSQMHH